MAMNAVEDLEYNEFYKALQVSVVKLLPRAPALAIRHVNHRRFHFRIVTRRCTIELKTSVGWCAYLGALLYRPALKSAPTLLKPTSWNHQNYTESKIH